MGQVPERKADAWREALKIISRCPVCGTMYQAEDAAVYARFETASLVHISCRECQGFFVAMIVLLGAGVSSIGMITDLSFSDIKRLHQLEPLTVDELIAGHLAIQQTTTLFSQLAATYELRAHRD